jgi:hypothetical protein
MVSGSRQRATGAGDRPPSEHVRDAARLAYSTCIRLYNNEALRLFCPDSSSRVVIALAI